MGREPGCRAYGTKDAKPIAAAYLVDFVFIHTAVKKRSTKLSMA